MFGGREAGPFQWPFVGLTVLLVLLIVTTPGLLSVGAHSAGSPNTSAALFVYRSVHGNQTTFTIMGVEITGYRSLALGLAPLSSWPYTEPLANLTFTNWTNASDCISTTAATTSSLIAVNATAVYVDAQGARAVYQGVYAFNVTATTIDFTPLTPGLSPGIISLPIVDLPEPLPLLEVIAPP